MHGVDIEKQKPLYIQILHKKDKLITLPNQWHVRQRTVSELEKCISKANIHDIKNWKVLLFAPDDAYGFEITPAFIINDDAMASKKLFVVAVYQKKYIKYNGCQAITKIVSENNKNR